ncbi:TetR/AcrR family transcriptional regulator [Bacillus sp. FJAT-27245]|uniref:TetR/AcrR family transcriptional regulator n=1 Tax=Bacillus sp. FJAT-27245 TaxID=1684144 RepID=UPI0006A7ECB0|nr:TetR/AcrR family transcriptional regulator [Bacillus sp. FJAT-27245]
MNDRKQHVITTAHQLFIEKGFQSTSIQDILDYSGISKGTFYNYFSSKNELLIELIKSINKQLEIDRNDLLIGQKRSDIGIFIKQVELHLKTNRANKLLSLYEEVMIANDSGLKEFLKKNHLRNVHWVFQRFTDIFGDEKKPYLLDCAIMFIGMLQQNLKFNSMSPGSRLGMHEIVRYSVDRIVKIVHEVSEADDRLLDPSILDQWLPGCAKKNIEFQQHLHQAIVKMKKALHGTDYQKLYELLDFMEEELLHSKVPRGFLIESVLNSLKAAAPDEKAQAYQAGLEKLEGLASLILSHSSARDH